VTGWGTIALNKRGKEERSEEGMGVGMGGKVSPRPCKKTGREKGLQEFSSKWTKGGCGKERREGEGEGAHLAFLVGKKEKRGGGRKQKKGRGKKN